MTPEAQTLIDEITAILAELANDPDVEYNEADVMAKVTALAEKAKGGKSGARDLRNIIRKEVEDKIAEEIIGRLEE